MNRQDAKPPTTKTPHRRRECPGHDSETFPEESPGGYPGTVYCDGSCQPIAALPLCRERLSPPARTLLALLVRAESLPCGGNMQLVSGQIQTAKALELRNMLATWEPFDPKGRFMTQAQRRRNGRKVFARITPLGKDLLRVWERCNVPESDYTPGIHPNYAER